MQIREPHATCTQRIEDGRVLHGRVVEAVVAPAGVIDVHQDNVGLGPTAQPPCACPPRCSVSRRAVDEVFGGRSAGGAHREVAALHQRRGSAGGQSEQRGRTRGPAKRCASTARGVSCPRWGAMSMWVRCT